MNRAERRRLEKLERPGKKMTVINQAIAGMIQPIVVLLNAQRFDKAEAALNELLTASPDHAEGLHLLGLLLCQTGREEQGIASLRRATSLAPKTALYWNNLAAACSRHHQWDESIVAARKAMALEPNYADPRYILVNILLAQGNVADGADELAGLLKLRTGDADLWHQLGQFRAEQQRMDESVEAYKRVIELTPSNVSAMRELAAIYMNTWRYADAQQLQKQADQLEAADKL